MSERTTPPFRADHVGSLLRPPELLKAREDHAAGRIDDDELRAIEDDGDPRGRASCRRTSACRSATDGEFRRASWHMDFIYQLGGITKVADGNLKVQFHNEEGDIEFTPAALHVDEQLALEHTIFGDAFEFLQEHVGDAPRRSSRSRRRAWSTTAAAAPRSTSRVYPDMDEFWSDLAAAYARGGRGASASSAARTCSSTTPASPTSTTPSSASTWRDRRRRRAPARDLHPPHQRGARRPARGHGRHHAHVPRQLPLLVGGRGRLRLRRRGAVQRARGRRLLPGVGRRALRRLRAAALRAQGQARRARPRHHQARRAGEQGRPQAPDRRGVAVRRRRPALPVAAVRLLLDRRGQRAHATTRRPSCA